MIKYGLTYGALIVLYQEILSKFNLGDNKGAIALLIATIILNLRVSLYPKQNKETKSQ
jgi:hypothetical protein